MAGPLPLPPASPRPQWRRGRYEDQGYLNIHARRLHDLATEGVVLSDRLHRHVFDPRTGRELLRERIAVADLPTLDRAPIEAVGWRREGSPEARRP